LSRTLVALGGIYALGACGRLDFDAVSDRSFPNCPADHDEDGDGLGDPCDPCPHIAGDDSDRDHDGVGDACDPAPDTPGNAIVSFLAFDAPPAWNETTSAPWTYANDVAHVALVGDQVAALTIASFGDVVVQTRVVVSAVSGDMPPQNPARNFAVIDNYDVVTDSGLFAGMVQQWGTPLAQPSILRITDGVGTSVLDIADADPTIALDVPYELTYRRMGAHISETLDGPDTGAPFALATDQSDTGGQLGIRARGVTIDFAYVIVIR
jgi:hypothetical protein